MLFVNSSNFDETIERLKAECPRAKSQLLPQLILKYKTLVLDFEGTLVYSNRERFPNFDFSFNLVEDNPKTAMYFKIRPNVFKFLEEVSRTFEIVLFSSHSKEHGSKILKHIDPSHRISYALYRDKCININKVYYLKSLKRLGRQESNVIFIDVIVLLLSPIFHQVFFNPITLFKSPSSMANRTMFCLKSSLSWNGLVQKILLSQCMSLKSNF